LGAQDSQIDAYRADLKADTVDRSYHALLLCGKVESLEVVAVDRKGKRAEEKSGSNVGQFT
jgi:hypothetical protein